MKIPKLVREAAIAKYYSRGVIERDFEFPDGTVENFKLFTGTTPVIIFALTEKREVIAVRQFRFGANNLVLELPGGNIKQGDSIQETVRKELLEETGYSPNSILVLSDPIWFDPASFTVSYYPVLALGCKKVQEPKPDKTEILETVLTPCSKWLKKIANGRNYDNKTIAVTFLAQKYVKSPWLRFLLQFYPVLWFYSRKVKRTPIDVIW